MARSNTLLRLLNLDRLGQKAPQPAKASPKEAANPWLRAEAQTAESNGRGELPWRAEVAEGPRWYWKVLRVILIVALVIVLLVGLRTMFFPAASPAVKSTGDTAATFPAAAASGVADRFASDFLTWDAADPSARSNALGEVVAGGVDGDKFGWDGTGKQQATAAYTIAVDPSSAIDATVTVAVQVHPYDKDGKELPASWQAVAVPVHMQAGRAAVAGSPALVAVPAPHAVDAAQAPAEDTGLSHSTEDYAKSFFAAYASGTDVSAVAAPAASFTGLGGAVRFQSLTSWTVYASRGDTRQARAVVAWETKAGTTLTATYAVTLTRVTAGSATRWQVAAITASEH